MFHPFFYIIIGIIVADFVFERGLDWLNATWRSKPVPEILQGIYNEEKYVKQQEYAKATDRFSLLTSSVSIVFTLAFLFSQGFVWLNTILLGHFENPLAIGLVFFGILFLAIDIIGIPFEIYSVFVIEERFGFNKSTPKIFIADKVKGYLLSAIIGAILYVVIYKLNILWPEKFWIYAWCVVSFFMVFIAVFYSNLIVPLFNKQKPLEDGELKDAIQSFAIKAGFKVKNIYEIDGSKRSTRANAYFTGFGKYKRIVLYDTLIKELTTDEILAVLAHEIGHNKKKHTITGLLASLAQLGIMLYILSLFINNPELSAALGSNQPFFHLGLITFAILYSPISTVSALLMNMVSRHNEYQADKYAGTACKPEHLVSALKKLASNNLTNLTPHPVYVFLNYSHPTLFQRIKKLNEYLN
jgi:STE24 endopeptidase